MKRWTSIAALCIASGGSAQEHLRVELAGELTTHFPADIDGDGTEEWVAACAPDDEATRRTLRAFAFEQKGAQWQSFATDTELPEDACAIACGDVLPLTGTELLVFDTQGLRVHPLQPADGNGKHARRWHPQGRTLLEAPSFFGTADRAVILHWPLIWKHRISNQSAPVEPDRFQVLAPMASGYAWLRGDAQQGLRVIERFDLRAAIAARRVWDGSLFTVERELPLPSLADFDGDGREELVLERASDDTLWFHLKDKEPQRLEHEGIASSSGASNGGLQKHFRRLIDLDRDHKADFVAWTVRGDARQGFAFETELITQLGLGTTPPTFAAPQRMSFRGAGSVSAFEDLDGDGLLDLIFVRCENPAAAIVGGLATLRTSVYLARAAAQYAIQPEFEVSSRLPLSFVREDELRAGRLPHTLSFARDFDGDGTHDLFAIDPRQGITIRLGVLEKRELDGREWRTYRLQDEEWFRCDIEVNVDAAVLEREGRPYAIVVPRSRGATFVSLP